MSSNESLPVTEPIDVAIIGGGIAGLWTLNRLVAAGYNAVLIERDTLGGVQTIAAQGVLHGGVKYTLKGSLNDTSETIGAMPRRWRDCLSGNGEIDLSSVPVLSEFQVLWSPGSLGGKLTSFFASKALKSRVDTLEPGESPQLFGHPQFKGSAYKIHEQVIDVPALLAALATPHAGRIVRGEARLDDDGVVIDEQIKLAARTILLTAGAGTEALLQARTRGPSDRQTNERGPAMQRRPLHQVIVRGELPPFFSVCLGTGPKPRLVSTTHPAGPNAHAWYLGGNLAETGVQRSESEQIAFARRELETLLPWIDLSHTEWSTLRVDRAEPATAESRLPSGVFCQAIKDSNILVSWPTKLVLAPLLADAIFQQLPPAAQPGNTVAEPPQLERPSPAVASAAWQA